MTQHEDRRDGDAIPHDEGSEHDTAPRPRAITRRRFVGLIAAGAGATLAAPVLAAAPARRGAARAAPDAAPDAAAPSPKVAKGLAEQRESLDKTLKIIRGFELPPGSEQGFAFRPLSPRRKP